ncbi:flagellar filament capping protein FliD [Erwiniaceae bacterium BAC15a-03b]|uniref:Flagellar hook-associated protein 2 n=1 Tax=Winslowiella arboricola TaxID=2978220 RepID=A0A9J6PYW2_9GAMM|nr:flagellar filament capping protein FliD [Winslowiella arboricola]MCU5773297.1 flagellar filament capping protein FliD [Winslowiella arboricola]MCU5779183.1 flagellar filament capping protein FliD [Winslowiella arboricola]
MASVSSLGVGTSLDLDTLYTSLETAEKTKLTAITTQQSSYSSKLTAYGKLSSSLTSLQTAVAALTKASAFTATSVTSSNTAFTATTDATASTGDYSVYVEQIAKAQSLISGSFSSKSTQLGETTTDGTRTISISQGSGDPLTITLKDSQTTLSGIVSAINSSAGNVSASIITASNGDYRLLLSSKTSGTDGDITLAVSGDDTLQGLIGYDSTATGTQNMSVQTASQNAKLSVNGVSMERSSNTITDALTGVTLNLKSASSSTDGETLSVGASTDTTLTAIKAFVTAYNSLQSTIASATKYTAVASGADQSSTNGALLGDNVVRTVQTRLASMLTTVQSGGSYSILAQMGISIDPTTQSDGSTGALTIDETKLTTALTNNPQAVSSFFIGDGSTTGFATTMNTKLTDMLSTTVGKEGIIKNAKDGIQSTIDDLSDRYDSMEASIEATMARYKTQFTNLSTLISSLTNTSSYLTSQFATTSSSS